MKRRNSAIVRGESGNELEDRRIARGAPSGRRVAWRNSLRTTVRRLERREALSRAAASPDSRGSPLYYVYRRPASSRLNALRAAAAGCQVRGSLEFPVGALEVAPRQGGRARRQQSSALPTPLCSAPSFPGRPTALRRPCSGQSRRIAPDHAITPGQLVAVPDRYCCPR